MPDWLGGISVLAPSPADRRPAPEEPEIPLLGEEHLKAAMAMHLAMAPLEQRAAAIDRLREWLDRQVEQFRPPGPIPDRLAGRLAYVYFVRNPGSGLIKIGTSRRDPYGRMRELQIGAGCALEMVGFIRAPAALEKRLHQFFAAAREYGEWFSPAPGLLRYIDHYAESAEPATVERPPFRELADPFGDA